MTIDIIRSRLNSYNVENVEAEESALKEILQEIILYGLSTTDFFKKAMFQGGTALRILYGLPRFSEDLDFLLKNPEKNFHWQIYMESIFKVCEQFGIIPEVMDKKQVEKNIQKIFFKDNSLGKMLQLSFTHSPHKKLTIKLEIDTNPPLGSNAEIKFLDFPIAFSVIAQDLPSNFAIMPQLRKGKRLV